jgi:hypothetical protein
MGTYFKGVLWAAALALAVVLCFLYPAAAQGKPGVVGNLARAQATPTRADGLQALQSGALPAGEVLLTVDPDTVVSPADTQARDAWEKSLVTGNPAPPTIPAPLGKTSDALAAQFGYRVQTFGTVTAPAPATRIALTSDPGTLDLSADHLPLEQALKLLLGSLSPSQMQQLGGDGLGPGDLSVPSFDAGYEAAKYAETTWLSFRAGQHEALTARLAAAAPPGRAVFLRPQANTGTRFTSWAAPSAPAAPILLSTVTYDPDHPGQAALALGKATSGRPAGSALKGILLDITGSALAPALDALPKIIAAPTPERQSHP